MSKLISKHKSRRFRRFLKANEAVSALEYAILVGVIAVAVGAAARSIWRQSFKRYRGNRWQGGNWR